MSSESSDLKLFIKRNGIPAELIECDSEVRTSEQASKALRVEVGQIVKSIVFVDQDNNPILALLPGDKKADLKNLAAILGVTKLTLATSESVLRITGYPIGSVPPFGHRRRLPTVMDEEIMSKEVVYPSGGTHVTMMRIKSKDLLKFTRAKVANISQK